MSRITLDASNAPGGVNFRRVNGAIGAPTATLANDLLGFFTANGHDGSAPTSGRASVNFVAAENWSTTSGGAQINFSVTPNGSTALIARLTLDQDGTLRPAIDNANSLGKAAFRFSEVYAATGTINTSDAREKTPLAPIPDGVKRAVRRVTG